MILQERIDLIKIYDNFENIPSFKKGQPYFVQRQVKSDGTITWFGYNTNWVKEPNKEWTVLGTDYTVLEIDPINDPGVYPEGRFKFFPCEEPVYEKLYQKFIKEGER